jgi:D-tyrosyl-tRNA(Tyr) deacylase
VRIVLQRVSRATVRVDGQPIASIAEGLVALVGLAPDDDTETVGRMAQKCAELRIFADDEGKFNRSLLDVGGDALVVSQFTLLADARKGRRPSFTGAAPPDIAEPLVRAFADALRAVGVHVAEGRFGARMDVELVNSGPVTLVLDSADLDRPRRA